MVAYHSGNDAKRAAPATMSHVSLRSQIGPMVLMTTRRSVSDLDSTGSSWYAASRAWAQEAQLSDGTVPESNVTREQMVVMLYRYALRAGMDAGHSGDLSAFSDSESVSAWAQDAMAWAVDCGLIQGRGDALAPQAILTRAEAAALYQRFAAANMQK